MAKVSLKLEIAGRTYPISVLESEKDKVLSAANALNASIESLKKHYAVNDQQDLLAMASLQYLMKPLSNTTADYSEIEQKLDDLTAEATDLI
jgi:cell division protein ZapA